MATATWDPSVERIKDIAERDGIISYPDVIILIRSTLDDGGSASKNARICSG